MQSRNIRCFVGIQSRYILHMLEAFWLRLKADPPAYATNLLVETQSGPSCICQKPSG